jgi:hypothetical protein
MILLNSHSAKWRAYRRSAPDWWRKESSAVTRKVVRRRSRDRLAMSEESVDWAMGRESVAERKRMVAHRRE